MAGMGNIAMQGLKMASQLASTQSKANPAIAIEVGWLSFVGSLYLALDSIDKTDSKHS